MYRVFFFLFAIVIVKHFAMPNTEAQANVQRARAVTFTTINEPCESIKPDGYLFLKEFKATNASPEYSYVLTKGTSYFIEVCPFDDRGGIEVFNSSRELVFKSPKEAKGRFAFSSSATGIYYFRLTGTFDSKTATLSFKR